MTEKKKMSAFKFRVIMISVAVFCAILLIVVNVAAYLFTPFLDDRLGRGERIDFVPEGRDEWDTAYYEDKYTDKSASTEAAYKVALKVQEEGAVLLKNNGVLPLEAGSTVTPFGFRYKSPIYGQSGPSGSAKWVLTEFAVTPEKALKETFKVNDAAYDKIKNAADPASLTEAPGTLPVGTTSGMGHKSYFYEYPASIYEGATGASGTGLVFLGREGSEGSDKKYDAYNDGTPHYFALSQNEKDTIKLAKQTCNKVVVIIESSSSLQLPELLSGELEVDAILLFGHAGERGFSVLDDVLSGKVNPSGRTVAIWASDFTKDPTYRNIGGFQYTNPINFRYGKNYIEYAEDVYMGYRYYETAHDIAAAGFTYGELDGKGGYKQSGAVTYPFGYGLSYTTFEQKITSFDTSNGKISITVEVANKGAKAGKDVVEVYYNPPYTDFDKQLKIEKPTATLAGFAKTEMIEPGQKDTVTVTFNQEDMASYSYMRQNDDGTKGCYILEAGDYKISLRKNSHEIVETKTWNNRNTIFYDSHNPRQSETVAQSTLDDAGNSLGRPANGDEQFTAATNLFQDSSDYMNRDSKILSRADWNNSFPVLHTEGANMGRSYRGGKALSAESAKYFEDAIFTFDVNTDKRYGNVEGSKAYHAEDPVSGADNGLSLSDLRGKSYYDDVWNDWLDQIDYSDPAVIDQLVNVSALANYATTPVDSLGLPRTVAADGANGIKVFKTNEGMQMSATHSMTPVWASTWNVELLKELGDALGKEALENNVTAWYSPAIDLHRSPFSGRNFEYYSEDPLLTGKSAAAVVSGAGEAGMICYIKHFALNDQETNREQFLATWATEQAMRELYLKAFEIPFKEAMMTINYIKDETGVQAQKTMRAATAVMATQSCIGQVYGHADERLLTDLLRGEWGFLGLAHSDMFSMSKADMYDMSYRSGLDTFLPMDRGKLADKDSASAHHMFRRIMHNVGYTVVNSNAMQGVAPGTVFHYTASPWVFYLQLPVDLALSLVIAGAVTWMVVRTVLDKKKTNGLKEINNEKECE